MLLGLRRDCCTFLSSSSSSSPPLPAVLLIATPARRRLDVARETYKENLNDAFELCDVLSKEHNLDMNLSFQGGIFVFTCLNKDVEEREGGKLPSVFLHVVSFEF